MYWAQALAEQEEDQELKTIFTPVAKQLIENEAEILDQLKQVQGKAVKIGGYYHSDLAMTENVMRPSNLLNQVIDG